MAFLTPLMLAGLAALSIPVLLHLMNRFRVKTTDWAAMRFLETTVRRSQRRIRLEDILLLLLRCALVAIAVLAFARPALRGPAHQGSNTGGPVAAVILLDNSASMMQSTGAETRFDQAKKGIRDWLDEHDGRSLAALFLASNRTDSLMAKPENNFPLVRSLLESAAVTERGTELTQSIRLACEALKSINGLPREVHVYTDAQATAWEKMEELRRIAEANPDVLIRPFFVGGQPTVNLGISVLKAEGGMPAARQPCRFLVEVSNYGSTPATEVKVALSLDGGQTLAEGTIPLISPGSSQSTGLVITFPDAGAHAVTASIPPDALPADNQRTAAIEVATQMNVLIVEEDHAGPPMDRDGYFLANALIPLPRERAARYYLGASFISPAVLPAELHNENNMATQAVFLCNVGQVSEAVTAALKDYVKKGGNLVVFPGPRTYVNEWQENTNFWDLLPVELAEPPAEETDKEPIAWQSTGFTHPVAALWNDTAQGSLGAIKVRRHFPLKLKAARAAPAPSSPASVPDDEVIPTSEPRVINRLSNNEPAVVEWGYGEGNVVVFNSTSTPEWNNLPLHPAFVPYLQRLMGYFNRKNESRLVLAPGEAFRKPMDAAWAGKEFSVLAPGTSEARTAGRIATDDSGSFLRFADTEKTGAYRLTSGGETLAMFSVQMDPAESDLRLVDAEAIQTAVTVDRKATTSADSTQWVVTQEFWTTLIWIAALLFAAEAFLAHRLTRARAV